MITKLLAQIFTSTIRSQKFNCLAQMILYFILKFFELFKGFRFMSHQVYITISTEVISEGNEVLKPISSNCAHWSTYIRMYEFQQVFCSFTDTGERRFGYFTQYTRFACII